MDVKRYFRGPVMWIALAVIAVILLMQLVSSSSGFKGVDTGKAIQAIQNDQVKSAKLIGGNDQSLELTLIPGVKIDKHNKIKTSYIDEQGVEIQRLLQSK